MCWERATFILNVPDKAGIVVQCVGCRLRHLKSYLFKVGLEFPDLKGSSWLLQAWRAREGLGVVCIVRGRQERVLSVNVWACSLTCGGDSVVLQRGAFSALWWNKAISCLAVASTWFCKAAA